MSYIITAIVFLIIGIVIGWVIAPVESIEYRDVNSDKTLGAALEKRLNEPAGPRSVKETEIAETSIIINARLVKVRLKNISYSVVVQLAGKTDFIIKKHGEFDLDIRGQKQFLTLYTVTYYSRQPKMEGMLSPVQICEVVPGMIFNVAHTGNA